MTYQLFTVLDDQFSLTSAAIAAKAIAAGVIEERFDLAAASVASKATGASALVEAFDVVVSGIANKASGLSAVQNDDPPQPTFTMAHAGVASRAVGEASFAANEQSTAIASAPVTLMAMPSYITAPAIRPAVVKTPEHSTEIAGLASAGTASMRMECHEHARVSAVASRAYVVSEWSSEENEDELLGLFALTH